jgi:hypothetical protein
MKYVYYNLNPEKKHVRDCVYRAIAAFMNIPWKSAVKVMMYHAIKDGNVNFNYTTNIVDYLENQGYKRHKSPKKGLRVCEFEEYIKPNKMYLIHTVKPQHLTIVDSCEGGTIYDIWDCGLSVMDWYFEKDIEV